MTPYQQSPDDSCALVSDPENADLSRFELTQVSSLVKKYLTHLPNPVIPVDAYDEMIALAKGTCAGRLQLLAPDPAVGSGWSDRGAV